MSLPFEKYQHMAWPFWYKGTIVVRQICGGVPASENTAESWIRAKLKDTRSTDEVQALVDKTKAELRQTHEAAARRAAELASEESEAQAPQSPPAELTPEELDAKAVSVAAQSMAGLNMFKRTEHGVLYIEGRMLKAALKEAVSVAANAGKITTKGWGNPDNSTYRKQLKGWFPEHCFVPEIILPLHRDGKAIRDPDGIIQKFVHTHRGDAIAYEEYVNDAEIHFQVKTDVELTEEQWAMIWLTGQDQGVGASRSQGFGTYVITEWEREK
jgi:hypothetical protein